MFLATRKHLDPSLISQINLKKKFSTYDLRDISHYDVHDQKLSERCVNDAHYTRLANNLIADFIYDYLIDSGILIQH